MGPNCVCGSGNLLFGAASKTQTEVRMIRRRLGLTAIWAGGTFALAIALGLPATSNAVDDSNSPALVETILTPQFNVNGVKLTVTPEMAATRPSQTVGVIGNGQLKFDVRAENKTISSASESFVVRLTCLSPNNPLARTLPMPKEIWRDSADFNLIGGETKAFTFTAPLPPPTPLSPKNIFTLSIGSSQYQTPMVSMVDQIP
jgi:hypothetical protein